MRVAVARRVEEIRHMRGCPDRMGELERRLRKDGIELARSKGGAMATAGSHRVKPFGGRGRRERRADETRPWGTLPGSRSESEAMRHGVPPISGTPRPQGRWLRNNPESLPIDNSDWK